MKKCMSKKYDLQAQFKIFKDEFLKWCKILSLEDWDVKRIEHKPLEEAGETLAEVIYDITQKDAVIRFYGSLMRDYDIIETAKHEALHLLLAEATNKPQITHSIINRIIKVLK